MEKNSLPNRETTDNEDGSNPISNIKVYAHNSLMVMGITNKKKKNPNRSGF